jgi:hypothetical protein
MRYYKNRSGDKAIALKLPALKSDGFNGATAIFCNSKEIRFVEYNSLSKSSAYLFIDSPCTQFEKEVLAAINFGVEIDINEFHAIYEKFANAILLN